MSDVQLIAAEEAYLVEPVEAGLLEGACWSTTKEKTCDVIISKVRIASKEVKLSPD